MKENENKIKVEKNKSAAEVLESYPELKKNAVAIKYNETLKDLNEKLDKTTVVEVITTDSDEALDILRHSASHIMAQAVKDLYPNVQIGIGPATKDGFYYDFDVENPFTPEDLEKIEKRMEEIIKADKPFKHLLLPRKEVLKKFKDMNEMLKVELISEKTADDEEISLYEHDNFVDFCRGPHIPSTGRVPVVKLLSTGGAYWKGDERNKMLQRIYGTAFFKKESLNNYLEYLEEVKKRDHRKLGPQLDLYQIYEEAGSGLIFWHPYGATVRTIVEDFWKNVHTERGYRLIITPHIAHNELWKTSGHWDYYRENMYTIPTERGEYVLKPMNCPFHILIYQSKLRSFRDLPLRYCELGTVYRYERQGVLHGMLRVRGFTQDDAHIFCTPEQVEDEILSCLDIARYFFGVFGFKDYQIELSVRDTNEKEKYMGTDEMWDHAEKALVTALEKFQVDYSKQEGEAVFYGPKIDIKLVDAIGNTWQATTIQFDFNLPERFDINYIGSDSKEHRIIMIHRAMLGSLERFIGTLIEHYGGAFPIWFAPVQVVVIPISEKTHDYANSVMNRLVDAGLRAELDKRSEKMNYKIREAQDNKIPFMFIIGPREADAKSVSVRHRFLGDIGVVNLDDAISLLQNLDKQKIISFEDEWDDFEGSLAEWIKANKY